ncbi:MAG TPA: phosphatase PAP2 family protein [Chitinophagaceae bacterium]|nr:phosphatase PAP2 family protein [Chitinophagaceae bacterium]
MEFIPFPQYPVTILKAYPYFWQMFFLANTFWGKLLQWDRSLFTTINSDWSNPVFDYLMPFLRNSLVWIPLYLFVLLLAVLNFKNKAWWWVIFLLCAVAFTDMSGTYLFKKVFLRLRPCGDPDFYTHVRLVLNRCSGGHSFISNHAANHFCMASFFFLALKPIIKKWSLLFFLWAASIAYAQVYVGFHYPSDVLAGALVGVLTGCFFFWLFKKRFGTLQL